MRGAIETSSGKLYLPYAYVVYTCYYLFTLVLYISIYVHRLRGGGDENQLRISLLPSVHI